MSGFERSNNPERHDAPGPGDRPWPDEFSAEEQQFGDELRAFFPIEDEELPPLYIETLMGDARFAPLDDDDVRRITYAVERKLGLQRAPLFTRQWAPSAWGDQVSFANVARSVRRASRPLVAVMALLVFCMVTSVFLATPSFAQGLRLLFGSTGVQQVEHYPSPSAVTHERQTASSPAALSAPMPTFWAGTSISDYVYQGMRTLPQQEYTRGPILDIQYVLSERTAQQTGDGLLDIREFQIANAFSAVLQSVQQGSASVTSVNGLPAVYVDGMWVTAPGGPRTYWETGSRSMLIFERDGVIFWMVGDQRDGLGEAQLVQIASQMAPTTTSTLVQSNLLSVRLIGAQLSASMRDPIGYNTELLKVIGRSDSPEDAAGEFVAQGQPQPTITPLN